MQNKLSLNHGLTLIEVMVSVVLIVVLLAAAASTIINSQLLSSLARHKTQAAYAGEQILEQQRRLTFSNIVSCPSAAVTLDTAGTYNTTADDFLGAVTITVTPIDAHQKKVQVEIDWQERLLMGAQATMKEYFATTITDESQLD